jgi:hypothetical protein
VPRGKTARRPPRLTLVRTLFPPPPPPLPLPFPQAFVAIDNKEPGDKELFTKFLSDPVHKVGGSAGRVG